MSRRAAALAAFALLATGCGGASPLLHPARTMPKGDVRFGGGVAANVALGAMADNLRAARDVAARDPNAPGAPGSNPTYAKGALVAAAVGPGVSPFVSGRVGLGSSFEGGLAYTGRAARADIRHSFDRGGYSLSLGLGGSATLYGREAGGDLPNVDLAALHGYGLDLPILVGWQSNGGLYTVWAGARGGFEHDSIESLTSEPRTPIAAPPISLEGTRWFAGGLFGLMVGFRHVHVALELSASYVTASGTYNQNDVTVRGLSLAPATALWWTF